MNEHTQQYSDFINSLQSRIQALEDENRLLKERLDEAGVSYADISVTMNTYTHVKFQDVQRDFQKALDA